jgi:hypothetical protein
MPQSYASNAYRFAVWWGLVRLEPHSIARRTTNEAMDVYVDEGKARDYFIAAACVDRNHLKATRKELRNLILPGQRSIHMKDERDPRKREITDTIIGIGGLGMRVVIYDAGRSGTERDRRARCLAALVEDALKHESPGSSLTSTRLCSAGTAKGCSS